MRNILFTVLSIGLSATVYGQNQMEAKMAYQLAEEKFESKDYVDAFLILDRAEEALERTNAPIAYLRVLITHQLVISTDGADSDMIKLLETALADFDDLEESKALGEDKLMDIYRIKIEYETLKEENEISENLSAIYKTAFKSFFKDLPTTGISLAEFANQLKQMEGSQWRMNETMYFDKRWFQNKLQKNSFHSWDDGYEPIPQLWLKRLDLGQNSLRFINMDDTNTEVSSYGYVTLISKIKNVETVNITLEELIEIYPFDLPKSLIVYHDKEDVFAFNLENEETKYIVTIDAKLYSTLNRQYLRVEVWDLSY